MSTLVAVEARRFRYRAAVRWIALAAVLAALVTVLGAFFATTPPSAAELDQQRVWYEQSVADWEANGEQYVADCREQEELARESEPGADYGCDDMAAPEWENFTAPVSTFAGDVLSWTSLLAIFLLLLVFAAGVTFVTAEHGAGSLALWLTYVPRRGRVYASKVVVAALGAVPPVLVALVVGIGGAWLVASLHDAVGDVTTTIWADLGWQALRTVALAVVVGAIGAALGFALRSAAAALGLAVGWFLLVDLLLSNVLPVLQPWTLRLSVAAWLGDGAEYGVMTSCEGVDGASVPGSCWVAETLTLERGALQLGVVALVLVAVGFLLFRRRDLD